MSYDFKRLYLLIDMEHDNDPPYNIMRTLCLTRLWGWAKQTLTLKLGSILIQFITTRS